MDGAWWVLAANKLTGAALHHGTLGLVGLQRFHADGAVCRGRGPYDRDRRPVVGGGTRDARARSGGRGRGIRSRCGDSSGFVVGPVTGIKAQSPVPQSLERKADLRIERADDIRALRAVHLAT